MDKSRLKQIILSNQREVENREVFVRDYSIDDEINYVLVGVRRAGKSYLLFQRMQQLLAQGRGWDEMLYINFEDDRLEGFTSANFEDLLECHAELYGNRPTLFLDEIQNVPGWEKFARRMADNKYRVYITGSNATMLSREIMTTLGGRYIAREVYPFSLQEYLDYHKVGHDDKDVLVTESRALIKNHVDDYLHWGGLPESFALKVKRDYLSSTFQRIYLGDISSRNGIANPEILRLMLKKMADGLMQPVSYTRLANTLSSLGTRVTMPTVSKYISYCEQAWMLLRLRNIKASLAQREANCKYYFVDNGILNLSLVNGDASLLENAVALHLFRKYGHNLDNDRVYYYNDNVEVDFYVPDDELAIQVTLSVANTETLARESRALTRFATFRPCRHRLIITLDDQAQLIDRHGPIDVLPYWKWALGME